jgi:DNA mismatch repair protein MutS2
LLDKHLETLELPKILEQLASLAVFSASQDLARQLRPTPHLAEAQQRQAETREARQLSALQPDAGVHGARDVRPLVSRAERGISLFPQDLLNIRQTLVAARDLRRIITRLAADQRQLPYLADMAYRLEEVPGLVNDIGRCLDDSGEVKDDASSELARLRRELSIVRNRLLDKLNRLVNSPQKTPYLQEALVTQRDGRYVIPLKAEFKGRIRGIVHDQSSSGATLFVEPLVTVEMNNNLRQLQLEEEEEVRRILLALSAHVALEGRKLGATVQALAELDLAFAKAKYADQLQAVEPELVEFETDVPHDRPSRDSAPPEVNGQDDGLPQPGTTVGLHQARHPLLNPETAVPIDIVFDEGRYILVITGPNTGGKTVSLKTVGLLALMAQAGLHIPAAEGSRLSVFKDIWADIGHEQSIEQSLSTFSAHLTNVVEILQLCNPRSLVILDELGAGTDPIEGAALARSILMYLREKGVTTLVATHYSELKAYAHVTPGLRNASMEFNLESLSPTYRLTMGLPGRSNAFAIAERLGLEPNIVGQAQALVGVEAQETEAMLAEIEAEAGAARRERAQTAKTRARLEAQLAEVEARLAVIERERRDILDQARAEAREDLRAARAEIAKLKAELTPKKPARQVREVEAALEALGRELAPLAAEPVARARQKPLTGPPRVGDKVWIARLDKEGEVIGVQGTQIEVKVGHFRTTLKRREVELRQRALGDSAEASAKMVRTPAAESPGVELHLRGQTIEEALINLDQYLDRAYLAGLPWVRVIHGKGTGALRRAVRDALRQHPLVTGYESGRGDEGGEGVTVARLATI